MTAVSVTACGTFDTTFSFTAKMDGPWPTSAEIHGRCHHPITRGSGTGGFTGASRRAQFHDVVVSPPYYPTDGNIHLADERRHPRSLAHRAAISASEPALSC